MIAFGLLVCVAIPVNAALWPAVQGVQATLPDAKSIATEAIAGTDTTVCDAVIVPADRSSEKHVLASVDGSGRRFCNGLLRITVTGRPTVLQTIDTWQVERVADVVSDLDQDGTNELVIPTAISDYEGANCIAVVPMVYTCASGKCAVAPTRFRDFYVRKASEAARRLVGGTPESTVCTTMERDKLLRLAGSNPRAGFDGASQWMNHPSPSLRRKAVRVFADIADDASRSHLRTLTTDRDPIVSASAEHALKRR